jgi:hypothetical protein
MVFSFQKEKQYNVFCLGLSVFNVIELVSGHTPQHKLPDVWRENELSWMLKIRSRRHNVKRLSSAGILPL